MNLLTFDKPHNSIDVQNIGFESVELLKSWVSFIKLDPEEDYPYKVFYINASFRDVLHMSADEEFNAHKFYGMMAPEDVDGFISEFAKLFDTQGEIRFRIFIDGEERWMMTRLRQLRQNIFITETEDVTEEYRREEEREKLITQYQQIFRHLPQSITVLDGSKIRFINESSINQMLRHIPNVADALQISEFGNIPEHVIQSLDLSVLVGDTEIGKIYAHVNELRMAGQLPIPYEYHLVGVDGKEYFYKLYMQDIPGFQDSTLVYVSDVTDEYRVANLIQALAHHEDTIGVVHKMMRIHRHELKSPLATLKVKTYLIRKAIELGQFDHLENHLRYLENFVTNVTEILDITIDDVLSMMEDISIERGSLDFAPLVMDIIGEMQTDESAKEDKAININFQIDLERKAFYLDALRMRQVMTNLIGNAIKYSPDGKEVSVRISDKDNSLRIVVSDNGIGIPANQIDQVFQPMFRASNAREMKIKGTGLGLVVVQKIVQMHGGTISVTSEQSKGTEFVVEIPISVDPSEAHVEG